MMPFRIFYNDVGVQLESSTGLAVTISADTALDLAATLAKAAEKHFEHRELMAEIDTAADTPDQGRPVNPEDLTDP